MSERLNNYDGPTAADGPDAITDWIYSGKAAQESVQARPDSNVDISQLAPERYEVETVDTDQVAMLHEARAAIADMLPHPTQDDVDLAGEAA